MSTSTTTRGALLRRAGTLLVAAALVGAPATSAFADPTAEASPSASASASATSTGSPTATATGSSDPSATTSPSDTTSPSPSSPAPSPSLSPTTTTSPSSSPAPTTGSPATQLLRGASPALLAAAAAATAAPQSAYGADFIARTLAAGDDHYVYPNSTFFDGGNTIDAILALDGTGSGSDQADAAFAYLEDNVGGYIGTDFSSLYAGPAAKALLAVGAHGADPSAFGGLDLVAELKSAEGAVEPGRFSDLPVDCGFSPCDYSNTIGQSLAIIALLRAGETLSTDSVAFLLDQQCADGGFRNDMDSEGCASDADATAFAAQALIAAEEGEAANDALGWLADAQLGSGALENAEGVANANTTGVAAQAFAAGGRDADLAEAQAFLVSLQYACSSPAALRGGIAFSESTRSTTAPSDTDLRATPQATLGLSGQSLLSVEWSEGASAGTNATPCTTTPTTDPSPSVDPTAGAGGSDPSVTVDNAATGSLAQTGTDLALPALLGLLLVVVGGLAVWASSRRRGAHA